VITGAKPHKALLSRLQRLSHSLSRKAKLAKLHARIANIRKDCLHPLTTDLTRRFSLIGIEDLNVAGMVKNRHLSCSISDMGFFEFRRQLEYKADMRGSVVVVADRFFASSKTCSHPACGHKLDKLPLSVRKWTCPYCGTEHDREVNAAINLANYAVSSTVSACRGDGAGLGHKPKTKPAPLKQEFNRKLDLGLANCRSDQWHETRKRAFQPSKHGVTGANLAGSGAVYGGRVRGKFGVMQ
jgi:putative transposase